MLIGIDASRANKDYKTGTEWYAYHIIRSLSQLDKENQYILYSDKPLKGGLAHLIDGKEEYTKDFKPEIDKNNFQKITSPHNNFKAKILRWPFKFFWTQGRLSLEMIFAKPDLLFIPAHALPIIHPKKSIVTIHDIGYEKNCAFYQKEAMGAERSRGKKIINIIVKIFTLGKYGANSFDYLKWSTGYALKRAYKIIVPSNFTKNDIENFYQKKFENLKIIYHGFDKNLYKKISEQEKIDEILNKYEIKRPYFIYIGRIEKKKNIPSLIEAFAIFKEKIKDKKYKLLLVGNASYGYDETNYMIREYNLDGDVIMPGWIKEKHIPFLLNGAVAFVFPSKYEGFGIPLLQAMACETPIIASDRASIPEVAEDASLLFDPDSIKSIAKAMEEVIANDELRKRIIDSGKKRIKNFSWELTAQKTLKEFKS